MKILKSIILLVGIIFVFPTFLISQTTLVDIPIVTEKDDGIVIEILVYDEIKKDSSWTNINNTYLEYDKGWYATGKINIKVRKNDVYYFRFRRGSKKLKCYDYTYLTIHGGAKKEIIKNTKGNPIIFEVNGIDQVFGIPTEDYIVFDPRE